MIELRLREKFSERFDEEMIKAGNLGNCAKIQKFGDYAEIGKFEKVEIGKFENCVKIQLVEVKKEIEVVIFYFCVKIGKVEMKWDESFRIQKLRQDWIH